MSRAKVEFVHAEMYVTHSIIIICSLLAGVNSGTPKENIVQNHLNIALLNVLVFLNTNTHKCLYLPFKEI